MLRSGSLRFRHLRHHTDTDVTRLWLWSWLKWWSIQQKPNYWHISCCWIICSYVLMQEHNILAYRLFSYTYRVLCIMVSAGHRNNSRMIFLNHDVKFVRGRHSWHVYPASKWNISNRESLLLSPAVCYVSTPSAPTCIIIQLVGLCNIWIYQKKMK